LDMKRASLLTLGNHYARILPSTSPAIWQPHMSSIAHTANILNAP
jgi:hypothetical protein